MIFASGAHTIHVHEHGAAGPVVVLLHSSGMSSAQWRRLVAKLAPDHRVLVPDLIGYGASGPWQGSGGFDLRDDAAVAIEIARRAGAPVHFVGHSYGGLIALLAAASGEVAVASVTAYEPVAFGVLHAAGGAEIADLPDDATIADFFAPELEGTAAWCGRFVDFWQGPGAWDRLGEASRAAFAASARKMFHEVRACFDDRRPASDYASITAPTLLLAGSRTLPAAKRVIARLAGALPQARAVLVEGAGHLGPLTHPDLVNQFIADHIRNAAT